MKTQIPFTKMVGAGNDFVVIDTIHNRLVPLKTEWPRVSTLLCDRHRGIGADGILVLEPSTAALVKMRIFNPDGSEAEMCGNGARCVAQFIRGWAESRDDTVAIETAGGTVSATVHGTRVHMAVPDPRDLRLDLNLEVEGRAFRAAYVQMGVPHLVVPVLDLDHLDVNRFGRALRGHRMFHPHGANVNFTQADHDHPDRLCIRTYERGVETETLACGTGATASAVVHGLVREDLQTSRVAPSRSKEQRTRQVLVQTRSGDSLRVSFTVFMNGKLGRVRDVALEGEAHMVYEGTYVWKYREGR